MDGAFGGRAHMAGQPAQEEFPDLAGAACGLLRLRLTISLSTWPVSWLA
jgi:hypothetical protein